MIPNVEIGGILPDPLLPTQLQQHRVLRTKNLVGSNGGDVNSGYWDFAPSFGTGVTFFDSTLEKIGKLFWG